MASFAIGRYVPYNSFLHKLDARTKIAATILLMVALFMDYPTWSMRALMGGILFIVLSIFLYVSKMKISSILSSLKSMWFMVIFLLIIYILVPKENNTLGVAFSINGFVVYYDSFAEAAHGASEASNTQADMLDQIQQGIEQISGVVQSNSSAAQETSATSEELSAQSENLKKLVGQFKLRD